MPRDARESGFFIPLTAGILLLLVLPALFLFVVPIVEDPRPRKPIDGGYNTTVWDKWTWERRARQGREEYLRGLQPNKGVPAAAPPAGSP